MVYGSPKTLILSHRTVQALLPRALCTCRAPICRGQLSWARSRRSRGDVKYQRQSARVCSYYSHTSSASLSLQDFLSLVQTSYLVFQWQMIQQYQSKVESNRRTILRSFPGLILVISLPIVQASRIRMYFMYVYIYICQFDLRISFMQVVKSACNGKERKRLVFYGEESFQTAGQRLAGEEGQIIVSQRHIDTSYLYTHYTCIHKHT